MLYENELTLFNEILKQVKEMNSRLESLQKDVSKLEKMAEDDYALKSRPRFTYSESKP